METPPLCRLSNTYENRQDVPTDIPRFAEIPNYPDCHSMNFIPIHPFKTLSLSLSLDLFSTVRGLKGDFFFPPSSSILSASLAGLNFAR